MSSGRDDFYVGWEPAAPAALGRAIRARALVLLALAAVVGGALAALQAPFAPSRFEFGVVRTFEGSLEHAPYPVLVVERPGEAARARSRWLLTVFGKRGADAYTRPLDGRRVRMDGSLVHREGRTMVELLPDTLEDLGPAPAAEDTVDLGEVTVAGEVVDSKCFLGVMKPGNLKPHRACAARCISGGVPPVLVERDAEGRATYYLLVDEVGGAVNDRVLHLVAEPLEVTGRLEQRGDLLVLHADPASYRRR